MLGSIDALKPPDAVAFFRGLWRRYDELLRRSIDGDMSLMPDIEVAAGQSVAAMDRLAAALHPGHRAGAADRRRLEQAGKEVADLIDRLQLSDYDEALADGELPLPVIRRGVAEAAEPLHEVERLVDQQEG